MANPEVKTFSPLVWVKVATAVRRLFLYRVEATNNYYRTYRLTGQTAPVDPSSVDDIEGSEAILLFADSIDEELRSSEAVDVYVLCASVRAVPTSGKILVGEVDNTRDIYIQDQTSFPIEYFLTQKIQDVVLAQNVDVESHRIDLEAGHGFVVGNYIEIKYDDGLSLPRLFQGEVIAINVNQITVMPSLDFNVDTQFILSSKRTSAAMQQLAGATIDAPVEFDLSPVDNLSYDLTAITVGMITATNPDDGLFGDQPKLVNGMYFGYKELNDQQEEENVIHLANVSDNGDFRIYCGPQNVVYTSRSSGGGQYGISAEKIFNGQNNYGVVARLSGSKQYFYVSVHDNVNVVRLRMKVRGHVVEP